MKKLIAIAGLIAMAGASGQAQILLSGGLTYSQNFDSLSSNSGTSSTVPWADNSTLLGWYASRAITASGGAYGPTAYTSYRVDAGAGNSGWVYSYGSSNATDRAFGTLSSGSTGTNAIGLRLRNDTGDMLGNVTISYKGEQWRNGGNTAAHSLYFTYQVSVSPFNTPISALSADPGFTSFSGLDFVTPVTGASATAVDGNAAGNYTLFNGVVLPGVTLNPGDEILLRWYDINDAGNDHGFAVDDLTVGLSIVVPEPSTAALAGLALLSVAAFRRSRR